MLKIRILSMTFVAGASLAAQPASAVSIVSDTSALVSLPPEVVNSGETTSDQNSANESTGNGTTDSPLSTGTGVSAQFSNAKGSGSANAISSVDAITGVLRADARGSITGFASNNAAGIATLEVNPIVNGTGTLTAMFAIDGDVSVFREDGAPRWDYQARVSINGNGNGPFDFFDRPDFGQSNSVQFSFDDEILTASLDFFNAVELEVSVFYSLVTSIGVATGFVDGSSSGSAFLEATDGLTFRFANPDVLSDPAFPDDIAPDMAAVPIGYSLPMLLLGLIGLGSFWRPRSTVALE